MTKRIAFTVGIILLLSVFLFFISKNQFFFSFPSPARHVLQPSPSVWKPAPLKLDTIFLKDHSWIRTVPEDRKWILIATGDVIPARSVNSQTIKHNDFTWAWENIIPVLSSGDITLINLESPLIPNCPVTVEGMIFCGDQRHIKGLKDAHVTVANIANNHMGNYGEKGILETKRLLEASKIHISGFQNPAGIEIQGLQIAFLGFDDIGPHVPPIAKADEEEMKKQIFEAKNHADIVIVSMSWGVEYTDQPSDRQVALAHLVIDSGADLVIGNHPHWIQPVELYKGKVIMYAHGNTIFDQMWSEETKEGVIGKYTFYGKELVDVEFIPTYIKNYGQPILLEGAQRERILRNMQSLSQ